MRLYASFGLPVLTTQIQRHNGIYAHLYNKVLRLYSFSIHVYCVQLGSERVFFSYLNERNLIYIYLVQYPAVSWLFLIPAARECYFYARWNFLDPIPMSVDIFFRIQLLNKWLLTSYIRINFKISYSFLLIL